ncbi:MAG TPA: hypothetical protein DCR14_18585 [Acidimicrobiaceae bacterium]|nr:hypothetical protein [Acidimicrobiaceae bacterium]
MSDTKPTYPLRQIRLSNFKSIVQAEVDIAPLTVLVGANSSGKSSILRAILALHQVAVSESPLSTFALNGPKSSLGYFNQVRNQVADDTDVEIGVDLDLSFADVPPVPLMFDNWTLYSKLRARRTAVTLNVAFSELVERSDEAASPSIVRVDLHSKCGDYRAKLALRRANLDKKLTRATGVVSGSLYPPDANWRFDEGFRGSLTGSTSTKVTGAAFSGGVPVALIATARGDAVPDMFTEVLLSIRKRFAPRADAKATPKDVRRVAACAIDVMVPWAGTERTARGPHDSIVNDVFEAMKEHELMEKFIATAVSRPDELRAEVRRLWPTRRNTPYLIEGQDAQLTAHAASQILGFLSTHTFYLAGLRVAPQPLYPFTSLPSDSDIGTRGENLASVLITIGDREVACPADDGTVTTKTLHESLRHWIRHLGLLDDIEPVHRGAQGFALEVRQAADDVPLDVSAVGVGVSQVLPVLVRCLLAAPGDLVMLEQPELHLHPAAQLGLADFLLACVRSGRQIIVESHSEHLVNRLRRRVAEADDDPELHQLIGIVFAERDRAVTRYRSVDLNPLGGFDSWPSGFFPEGADEVRHLLEAGLQKRARILEPD